MFRTKSDVDKHVNDLLRKVKNEHERNIRCFHIATMYYKAQDYESAKKYVLMYISVRDDSSLAHKLLGQCYEGLNLKDKALASYKRSLELEANQAELILKTCQLLCDKDVEFDNITARYWADRASPLFPHDPAVFMLKEKLIISGESLASKDLENLLHSELRARPKDVMVRLKLLKLYVDSGRTELALNHAFDVELKQGHITNLSWYQCITHICEVYNKEFPLKCDWEFYIKWISALDRVCSLSLSEVIEGSDLVESTDAVYNMDQIIFRANANAANAPEIFKEFIKHIGAQLMFHLTTLLLKRAKKQGNGLWKETKRMIVPLLLMAAFDSPNMNSLRNASMKETHQKLLKTWINYSRCRIVQAGQMLLSLVKEYQSEKIFLEKVFHFTVNNWKQQIFQKVFSSLEELNTSTSFFLTSNSNIPQKIPSQHSFKPSTFASNFENVFVGSLHHLVWLGIQCLQTVGTIVKFKIAPSFHTTYFKSIQFTVSQLNNVGVETLNQLDIDSFLYATVFCAGVVLEEQKVNGYFPSERPQILPADISPSLCTEEQMKWWVSVCSIIPKSSGESLNLTKNTMSDVRHILQRGIEIVRGENIPLQLLINLARTFSERANESEKIDEAEGCEDRALHLWQLAIPQLERLATCQSVNKFKKTNSMFDYPVKEMEAYEVNALLDEVKYFVGCHLMKKEQYEEAIEYFKSINTTQAAFNQALIYQKLADQQINGYRGEEVTSEMRCNQAVMASKARDSLYRARELIKDNHSHPFHNKIKDKLIEVDDLLSRIEPENGNTNLFSLGLGERDTDGSLSCESGGSPGIIGRVNHCNKYISTSTPQRCYKSKVRNNNSSEMVEILSTQQNTNQLKLQQVLEHVKLSLEKIDIVIFEQRSQRNLIEDFVNKFASLETETKTVLSEIKKEVKRPDLYNMIEEEEYPDEMLQYQNYTSFYPPQRNVQASGAVAYGAPAMPQYFSPRVDQMYQGNMGFYNQGALPFSDGQQLPDFLRTMQPKLPPTFTTTQGMGCIAGATGASAAQPIGGLNTVNKFPTTFQAPSVLSGEASRGPTNVVITTSDTLPTSVPPVQPTLSVTIPPQHRLGDISSSAGTSTSSAVHQFQIQLPHQSQQLPQFQQMQKPTVIESDDEAGTSESTNQETEVTPEFKPIAPQPKEVTAATVEEQEEALFSAKAKLFDMVDKNWKEIGTGDLKIVKDKTSNNTKILMVKEKVNKVCASALLTPETVLSPTKPLGRAWCWTSGDFSDDLAQIKHFCAKFENVEDSQGFKDVFDKAKSVIMGLSGKEMSSINIPSLSSNLIGQSSLLSMNVPRASASNTTITTAASFSQPFNANIQSTSVKDVPSSTANKINAGGFTFLAPPKFQVPEDIKNVKTTEEKKTESPFANFTFSATSPQSISKPTSTTSTTLFSLLETSNKSDGNVRAAPSTTGTLFSTLAKQTVAVTTSSTLGSAPSHQSSNQFQTTPCTHNSSFLTANNIKPFSENPTFFFKGAGSKVFGDFQSSKVPDNVKQNHPSPFEGAGSKLFGDADSTYKLTPLSKSPKGNETEAHVQNTDDEFVPTAIFEPLVPLPELVKVVSGEEGEAVLFEERAKLYRFCKETKQWKERGIGKMKILKNEETGVVRLVMRREQVFKVCCNHRLTKDNVLKPFNNSELSYSWAAKDFSDENSEGVNEIFTLKLKNVEQALAFKEAFETAQANLEESFLADSSSEIESASSLKADRESVTCECSERYASNKSENVKCLACGSDKDVVSTGTWKCPKPLATEAHASQDELPLSSLIKRQEGAWSCAACYVDNGPEATSCVSCQTSKPGTAKPPVTTSFSFGLVQQAPLTTDSNISQDKLSLSSLIKRQEGAWTCKTCYVENGPETTTCVSCQTSKSGTESSGPIPSVFKFGIPLQSGDIFGQKPSPFSSGGFVFGAPNNNKDPSGDSTAPTPVFNFALKTTTEGPLTTTPGLKFSFSKALPPIVPTTNKDQSGSEHGDSDHEGGGHENDVYFQPVIPLPDEITVVTGEEDEELLYSHRAKLYRYDSTAKEWKERGVGDIKILQHKTNSKIRLLMRREPVMKLSLNHYLTSDIIMKVKDDKSWLWSAKDFSSGEIVQEQFSIRFKNPDIAKEFKKAVDKALEKQTKPSSTAQSTGKTEKAESSISSDDNEIEIIHEKKAPDDLRKKAESLMLPPNFYLYLEAEPCPGCVGCEPDENEEESRPIVKEQDKQINIKSKDEESNKASPVVEPAKISKIIIKKSALDGLQPKPSIINPVSFKVSPSVKDKEESKPKSDNLVAEKVTSDKENVASGGSFFTQSSFAVSPTPRNIFGGSSSEESNQQPSIFSGGLQLSAVKSNQKFNFGSQDTPLPIVENVQPIFGGTPSSFLANNSSQKLIFGTGDAPSFGQLAESSAVGTTLIGPSKGSGDQTFNQPIAASEKVEKPNNEPRDGDKQQISPFQGTYFGSNLSSPWSNAPSSVFGNRVFQTSSPGNETSIGSEGGDENEHDPHFDPIVSLPELIDLKTGEEDEDLIFNERAKLYRYDSNTKEWKERGTGQIKILKHKENKGYYRLLMRREAVLKIVCNQRISSDFVMKPILNSEQAFCWCGMNLAQEYETPQLERLSVKFKNNTLAQLFKKCIDDAVQEIKSSS